MTGQQTRWWSLIHTYPPAPGVVVPETRVQVSQWADEQSVLVVVDDCSVPEAMSAAARFGTIVVLTKRTYQREFQGKTVIFVLRHHDGTLTAPLDIKRGYVTEWTRVLDGDRIRPDGPIIAHLIADLPHAIGWVSKPGLRSL